MFKRILKWTAVAFGLFMVYMLVQLFWPAGPIEVSPQTTVITEPLADDGLPDYSKYLLDQMREGVTPENNGAVPLLEALWPAGFDAQDQQIVCRELGMAVPTAKGLDDIRTNRELIDKVAWWYLEQHYPADQQYPDVDSDIEDWVEREYLDALFDRPWKAEDAPPVADWLDAHAREFDLLHEAAARPKFYLPSPGLLVSSKANVVMVEFPEIHYQRDAVRCLVPRANLSIGSGDLAGAWQDCQTMYQLANLETHHSLVSELVANACEGMANRTLMYLLASPDMTPELAARIQQFLGSRAPRSTMRESIDSFERLGFVTSMLDLAHYRRPENAEDSAAEVIAVPIISSIAMDWNTILKIGNQEYDQLVAALDKPTFDERQAALNAWDQSLQQRSGAIVTPGGMGSMALSRSARSENTAYILCQLMLPALQAAMSSEDRMQTQQVLLEVAVALDRYKLAQGEYPQELDALAPDFLKALPVDPFGGALVYQRTTDGYLLYSTGGNGKDNSGSSEMLSTYQGYPMPKTEEEDRALRKRLGLTAYEPEFEGDYQILQTKESDDDIAIRVPAIDEPLPKFEPGEDEGF